MEKFCKKFHSTILSNGIVIKKTNFPQPIQSGIYQYNLLEISLANMEKIINLHLTDTKIEDSISLFGGYAISINNKIELFPQCCGLLEEIQLWKNILNKNFSNFYLTECHPSPLITKSKNEIVIICDDENESLDVIGNIT